MTGGSPVIEWIDRVFIVAPAGNGRWASATHHGKAVNRTSAAMCTGERDMIQRVMEISAFGRKERRRNPVIVQQGAAKCTMSAKEGIVRASRRSNAVGLSPRAAGGMDLYNRI